MKRSSQLAPHGGPDGGPPIAIDFSTNAYPIGPNPWVRDQVARADRSRYPDPSYAQLRAALAAVHGVGTERVIVGAGASELIWRLTQAWGSRACAGIVTSTRTFGEYARAAAGLKLPIICARRSDRRAHLVWHCCPDNPSGATEDHAIRQTLDLLRARKRYTGIVVVDLAYWPFHRLLSGERQLTVTPSWAAEVIQLWSPNKLHGLTGVRGAYLILPRSHPAIDAHLLVRLAPSWVLGADGVALLAAHSRRESTIFLLQTAATLARWKLDQDARLKRAGWRAEVSPLHFGLWRPPIASAAQGRWHAALREEGIKLRDAASFGRRGWVRLVSRSPRDVSALLAATDRFARHRHRAGRF
jgi:histidinol-phosphate aminotransferase